MLDEYKKFVQENPQDGAILASVCKGSMSEGIDFSDNEARQVILVGIPNAKISDPKVILKQHFLNSKDDLELLNGSTWYVQQTIRTIN